METNVRGMRCALPSNAINKLLLFFSQMHCEFYIPWCLIINSEDMWLPESLKNYSVTAQYLQEIQNHAIWELVLHMYPAGTSSVSIKNYDDFIHSSCFCCLIYYDCGWLDIYVKESTFFTQLQNQLFKLKVEDFEILTDSNDGRETLSL